MELRGSKEAGTDALSEACRANGLQKRPPKRIRRGLSRPEDLGLNAINTTRGEERTPRPGHGPAPASPAHSGAMRILVVDDDEDIRTILRVVFESQGHEVIEATDGDAALSSVLGDEPDIVVLDVMLPSVDGYSALRRLRALSRTEGVPVVILSARAFSEDIRRGLELGADRYVTKPFAPDEFATGVIELAEMAPPARDARRRAQMALL